MSEKPTMVAMAMIRGRVDIPRLSATSPGMFAATARSTTRKKNWNLRYRNSAMKTVRASEPSSRPRSKSKRSSVSSGRLARVAASATRTTSAISRTRLLLNFMALSLHGLQLVCGYYSGAARAATVGHWDEQGIHARGRRSGRGDRSRAPGAAGAEELHHACGLCALEIGIEGAGRGRAAGAGEDDCLGGLQRRPLGERRLPLRQETAARDRAPHPLPHQAPRDRPG